MRRATLLVLVLAACSTPDPTATRREGREAPAPAGAKAAPSEKDDAPPAPAPSPAPAAVAAIGSPAPDFTLPDLDGKFVTLADLRGKTVVLEWFNPECPFVKYAHGEGPLSKMAATHTEKGIVWLAINSGAPGKQGAGAEKSRAGAETFGMAHPILLDEDGAVGKAYGAKTTPHMFVIDPEGKLVFRGGVDNAPMGKLEGEAQPWLGRALEQLAAGQPVGDADVPPYGCSVKYAS
jgi:peroxiredoxin